MKLLENVVESIRTGLSTLPQPKVLLLQASEIPLVKYSGMVQIKTKSLLSNHTSDGKGNLPARTISPAKGASDKGYRVKMVADSDSMVSIRFMEKWS